LRRMRTSALANSAVVLAVCGLHSSCGNQSEGTGAVVAKALVRILRNAREIQFVVLKSVVTMCRDRPALFVPFLEDFFVKAADPYFVRKLKLEVLTTLAEADNVQKILRELQSYVLDTNKAFVCDVVAAVGRVADAAPEIGERVVHGLCTLIRASRSEEVVSAGVRVVRHLVSQKALPADLVAAVLKLLVTTLLDDCGACPDHSPECVTYSSSDTL